MIFDFLKTRSTALAVSVCAILGTAFAASDAEARTVASAFIDGDYLITTTTTASGGTSTFDVAGSFGGAVLAPFPFESGSYEFSAAFSLNGTELFAGSFTERVTSTDFADLALIGGGLAFDLALLAGVPIPLPGFGPFPDPLGTLTYDATNVVLGPTAFSGDYTVDVDLNAPISAVVGAGLPFALDFFGLPSGLASGFTFPSNTGGTFEIQLSIAAVPLPASLPLLAAGGLLLVGLRRRASRKPAIRA